MATLEQAEAIAVALQRHDEMKHVPAHTGITEVTLKFHNSLFDQVVDRAAVDGVSVKSMLFQLIRSGLRQGDI